MRNVIIIAVAIILAVASTVPGQRGRYAGDPVVRLADDSINFKHLSSSVFGQNGIKRVAGFQDDETWAHSGAGVTGAADYDAADIKHGDHSWHVHVPDGITSQLICTLPDPITIRNAFGIWIKVDDASSMATFNLRIHTGVSAYYQHATSGYNWGFEDNTWKLLWVASNTALWSSSGSPPAWGTAANPTLTITKINILNVATGGDIEINYGDIIYQDFPKAAVVLGFDGPYDSQYDVAYPDMKARGWKGSMHVTGDNIGESGSLTEAQMREMYNDGWDVCSHGWDGTPLTGSTTTATIRSDLCKTQKTLLNMGFFRGNQVHSWLGNNGESAADGTTGEKAGDIGKRMFKMIRGRSLFVTDANKGGEYADFYDTKTSPWIPTNWWSHPFYSATSGDNEDFSNTFEGKLDLAIANREVLNVYIHRISDAAAGTVPSTDISRGLWNDLVAYLDAAVAADEIDVIRITEWYDRINSRVGSKHYGTEGDAYIDTGGGGTRRGI